MQKISTRPKFLAGGEKTLFFHRSTHTQLRSHKHIPGQGCWISRSAGKKTLPAKKLQSAIWKTVNISRGRGKGHVPLHSWHRVTNVFLHTSPRRVSCRRQDLGVYVDEQAMTWLGSYSYLENPFSSADAAAAAAIPHFPGKLWQMARGVEGRGSTGVLR